MKLELVGEAKTVLLRSWASILGMLATLFGVLGEIQPQLPLLQGLIPPYLFAAISILCAAAVPLARIIKQDKLRQLTGAANPQPGASNDAQ